MGIEQGVVGRQIGLHYNGIGFDQSSIGSPTTIASDQWDVCNGTLGSDDYYGNDTWSMGTWEWHIDAGEERLSGAQRHLEVCSKAWRPDEVNT